VIGFVVCVGNPEVHARRALRSYALVREPDSVLAELTDAVSIHAAYNEALDHFAGCDDLEALVLLHEDVELVDPGFCDAVRARLRDPAVAVLGTIGARGVRSLAWWEGEHVGFVRETRGAVGEPRSSGTVDTVDGLLLTLSPWAVRNLRFDDERFDGFHGYDVDICFSARAAGRVVLAADLGVVHHTKGGYGDRAVWDRCDERLRRKWSLGTAAGDPRDATSLESGGGRPTASGRETSHAAGDRPASPISLLLVLDGDEAEALRCLTAISELRADQPEHEIVVVADCAPQLDGLLARLAGDVEVVRTDRPAGFAAAATRGLGRCRGEVVVLLHGAPSVAPDFLAPLADALRDDAVAAAAAASPREPDAPAVATAALAARRADLPAELPAAPRGLELAALCTLLARRGEVVAVPASRAEAGVGARDGRMRRAPGGGEVELSIVIPTLDAAGERTRRCIRSAQTSTDVDHEIVVIDNGAPPQGFTAPVNAGLRAARGRYLLVLNDDVELLPGWWEPLRAALDAGAAVVFPQTVDGPMRHDFAAWCFALSRATLERFAVADGEFLDPDLVVWYQDTDLLERLRQAGLPPQHVPQSRIRHLLSATVNSDEPELRAWVARQVQADKAAFEAKHGAGVAGAAR